MRKKMMLTTPGAVLRSSRDLSRTPEKMLLLDGCEDKSFVASPKPGWSTDRIDRITMRLKEPETCSAVQKLCFKDKQADRALQMSNHCTAIMELHRQGKRQCDIANLLRRLSPQKLVDVRGLAMKVIVQDKQEIALSIRRRSGKSSKSNKSPIGGSLEKNRLW
ncbi:unnamed protein product [Heligmosomoides polygyrus]|uniref:DUF4476 domain-containing protein n=1 Tax=Heligmosomoides polygyrus TaxID=6339 RepID=A0A3P8BWC2_HELPZ|nr:unnamed protein product [Heligmosomoides polygyrus]